MCDSKMSLVCLSNSVQSRSRNGANKFCDNVLPLLTENIFQTPLLFGLPPCLLIVRLSVGSPPPPPPPPPPPIIWNWRVIRLNLLK